MAATSLALALWLGAAASDADVALARPGMHGLRLEGGGAVMITQPQTSRFDFGGGLALGYELRPIPWFGVGVRFAMVWFPSSAAAPTIDGYGAYYAPSLQLSAHPLGEMDAGDLWVAAAPTLTITGGVVRPGIEVGAGYEFDIAEAFRAGPFIRYHHVFETDANPGVADAGFLSFGLSIGLLGDPLPDRDGDGVPDRDDRCPDEPEDVDRFEDTDGCPDPDNDRDGILDSTDRCPNEPEDQDGFEDEDGCPDLDNDGDGVPDESDRCPAIPEDRDGFEDEDGCFDADNDRDGILDAVDRCPNEAEVVNDVEDEDGCPDARSQAEQELGQLADAVYFPRDNARLLRTSEPALRRVVTLLTEHPEIRRIEIQAHASAEGTPEYNMELSARRAQAIADELVRRGIAAERLTTRAFGDTQPVRPDDTPAAHAANRRVVFAVLERAR